MTSRAEKEIARFQSSTRTTAFQVQDSIGRQIKLSEIAEWDDDHSIERLMFVGPTEGIKILLDALGDRPPRVEDSNRGSCVQYEGIDAIDVNRAMTRLNLPLLSQKKRITFIVNSDSGARETVFAERDYAWNTAASGWTPLGAPNYLTESNDPVTRKDGCDFEINGKTYKSRKPVLSP